MFIMNAPNHITVAYLPAATLEALNELSTVVGERGHAQIWAINFRSKHGAWPTPGQIVIGLKSEAGLAIGRTTAWRALVQIKSRMKPNQVKPNQAI